MYFFCIFFFFSSRRRHTRSLRDWSSDVCSSDLNVDKVWQHIDAVLAQRAQRVPTAALNRWLEEASGRTPPPPSRGRSVKIRYVTQARVDPPEFVFFTTGPLSPAYRRYLEHDLRRTFGFEGTPLRVVDRIRKREDARPGAGGGRGSRQRSSR